MPYAFILRTNVFYSIPCALLLSGTPTAKKEKQQNLKTPHTPRVSFFMRTLMDTFEINFIDYWPLGLFYLFSLLPWVAQCLVLNLLYIRL